MSAYDRLIYSEATDYNPLLGDFTIEAFIYTEIVGLVNPVIIKRDGGVATNVGWEFGIDINNKLYGTICDGSASRIITVSDNVIDRNTWVRLAAIFDRDNNCILYTQGVEDGYGSISAQPASITNAENLEIGGNTSVPIYFGGLISEVKYSNKARTSQEINDSYVNGFTIDSYTVGLWRPDSYGVFRDVANGNDLTAMDSTNSEFIYLPRDEGIVANDVSNTPMRYTGRVKYNTELLSNCCYIYQNDVYLETNYHIDEFSFGDGSTDNPFSFSAWVNMDSTNGSIVCQQIGEWAIYFNTTSRDLAFEIADSPSGEYLIINTESMQQHEGEWIHICVTYNGNSDLSGMKIYVNGIASQTGTYDSGSYVAMSNTGNNFRLGWSAISLTGKICDVRVFNKELSKLEIETVMTSATDGSEVGWYPMAEGYGEVVHDVSGNGNHCFIGNGSVGSFWGETQSKFHYNIMFGFSDSIYLNGTSYWALASSIDFRPGTEPFTIEAIIWNNDYSSGNQTIYSNLESPTHRIWYFISTGGDLSLSAKNVSTVINSYTDVNAFTDGQCHYVAVVVDPGISVTHYVDGAIVASTTTTNNGASLAPEDTLYVGAYAAGSDEYSGIIHSVRYSNKARTSDNILNTYINGMVVDGNTISLWDFKNGEGIDAAGKIQGVGYVAGNGHNMTGYNNPYRVRIPANASDMTIDVTGQPIEHLAGIWHNGAETTIDFTGGKDTPFVNNIYSGFCYFDSFNSGYIDCGDNDLFSFGDGSTDSPFSISAWINMGDATFFPIIEKATVGGNWEWLLMGNTADNLGFWMYDESDGPSAIYAITDDPMTKYEGEWIHVCGTYDGSGSEDGINLYINGAVQSSTNTGSTYSSMVNGSSPVTIGRYSTYYAEGYIRDVRIYSGELSATEVAKDYKVGEIISSSGVGIIAEYKLHKNGEDSGENNLHGTGSNVYFPKITVPTSYAFGDRLMEPMYKKTMGNIIFDSTNDGYNSYISMKSSVAYGVWEFDIYKTGPTANIDVYIMSDIYNVVYASSIGYYFQYDVSERFVLVKKHATTLMASANSTYPINTWYNVRIVRNETLNQYVNGAIGTFAIYVNGILMSVTTGTNPVTDNTKTSTKYFSIRAPLINDKIRNIKINNELINYSSFLTKPNDIWSGETTFRSIGDRENSYHFFERAYINPIAMRPIHTYAKSKTIDDTLPMARYTTTTSSSTSTSTTSSSTTSTSTSTTSTSTSTTSTSISTSTT